MNINISGKTKLACLIGYPASHSVSPKMHTGAFAKFGYECVYLSFDILPDNLENCIQALKTLDAIGFNVTMPHKKEVMQYLDEIDKEAFLIGAVNTVKNQNGRLIGYNTDGRGYVKMLDDGNVNYKNQKVVICGAGGAGRSVAIAMANAGAAEIAIFDISKAAAENLAEVINVNIPGVKATAHQSDEKAMGKEIIDSTVFMHCTGVGMHPNNESSVINDPSIFHKELVVTDLIYDPSPTKLLTLAASRGCKTIDGTEMVYNQGVYAFKIFTGCEESFETIKSALKGE